MVLSVNAAVNDGNCDNENESPLLLLSPSKRKSELISPAHRGPLSDVNYKSTKAAPTSTTAAAKSSSTPCSKPRTLPPTARHSLSSINKFNSINKLKSHVQATNETQASVNQLSSHFTTESAKKNKQNKPPIHHLAPVRFQMKPRIQPSDVQATDSTRVSVKKLSSWMSDDPFQKKGLRTIRTGARVIAKSRIFEKDSKSAVKCDIKAGSVTERQKWLASLKHEEEDKPQLLQEKKLRPYQCKAKESTPVKELKSVRDKKEWLDNAFKGGENSPAIHVTKSFEVQDTAAHRPMIHPTKSCDDGITTNQHTMLERQRSVVRLYGNDTVEEEEKEEATLKSVHDKQAWLSSAFKKSGNTSVVGGDNAVGSVAAPPKIETVIEKRKKVQKEYAKVEKKIVSEDVVEPTRQEVVDVDNMSAAAPKIETVVEKRKEVQREHAKVEKKIVSKDVVEPTRQEVVDVDNMSVADRAKWLRGAFK